jgi:predicted metal-binding membrane protein
MPGQTWPGVAASFLVMWVAMMVPMMLPASLPALWRYSRATANLRMGRRALLTATVGVGYFAVWTLLGGVAFPLGVVLARLGPVAATFVVLVAGVWQLTLWKARHLETCRQAPRHEAAHAAAAWRYGVCLGVRCARSCANLMAALIAIDMMDVRAMTVVGVAIALERLAPAPRRANQGTA